MSKTQTPIFDALHEAEQDFELIPEYLRPILTQGVDKVYYTR